MPAIEAPPIAPLEETPEKFAPISLPDIEIDPDTRKQLKTAYERVKTGWIKGTYHVAIGERLFSNKISRVDRYCILGALGHKQTLVLKDSATSLFAKCAGLDSPHEIIHWNDAFKRRKSHVLSVFEELLVE